jgi:AcrR family transcriptional regulator
LAAKATGRAPLRRRGSALEAAILEAAWEELGAVGYAALTMEGVAARARTSRAVLYRRWPSRPELVVAALRHHTDFDSPAEFDTGTLRGDVLALLRYMSTRVGEIAGTLSFLIGASFEEAGLTPAALREQAIAGDQGTMQAILDRAAARGELDPDGLTSRMVSLPTDLVRHDLIMTLAPVPDDTLVEIVDKIFLPLVTHPS